MLNPRRSSAARSRREHLPAALLAIACSACSPSEPAGGAPARPARETIAKILERCLGDHADELSDIALELRDSIDAPPVTVMIAADGRTRVDTPGVGSEVLTDRDAGAGWSDRATSAPLSSDRHAELVRLRGICRALLFGPLIDATEAERRDDRTIAFRSGSDTWELTHDHDERPTTLTSTAIGTLRFVELGEPPAAALPRVVEIERLGRRYVTLRSAGTTFDATAFVPPDQRLATAPRKIVIRDVVRPVEPVFTRTFDCRWLVVEDPGDWADRVRTCLESGTRLGEHGQEGLGDPLLLDDKLAIPFIAGEGQDRYAPSTNETVTDAPAQTVATVMAEPGDAFTTRVEAARERLELFIAAHGQRANGPARTVVNLMYTSGLGQRDSVPSTMDVRVEIPIIE